MVGITADDHDHHGHQKRHAHGEQVTGQVCRAHRAADHDEHAHNAQSRGNQSCRCRFLAHPRPGNRSRRERCGGINDGDIGNVGILEGGDETHGSGTARRCSRQARPTKPAPRAGVAVTATPGEIGEHEDGRDQTAPEKHGPDIGLHALGKDTRRTPRHSRSDDQKTSRLLSHTCSRLFQRRALPIAVTV